jgi:hypothetical protein
LREITKVQNQLWIRAREKDENGALILSKTDLKLRDPESKTFIVFDTAQMVNIFVKEVKRPEASLFADRISHLYNFDSR